MKKISERQQLLDDLRRFDLESVFHEPLLAHLSLHRFEQGSRICAQGDPACCLYVLVEGKIKIYTTSAEGKTLILSFKNPLELIGDIEYVQGGSFLNTVEAVSPVRMIAVPYQVLKKHGHHHAPFLQLLLEIIVRKFTLKSEALSFNLLFPVDVRLASYLLSVTDDNPHAPWNHPLGTASLMDAAHLIGTSYRHLNRVIQQFCADGLIERTRQGIRIMDREGLRLRSHHNIYEHTHLTDQTGGRE